MDAAAMEKLAAANKARVALEYDEARDLYREILGGEWDDAAIEAVVAFLQARAPKRAYPELPVEGDPVQRTVRAEHEDVVRPP